MRVVGSWTLILIFLFVNRVLASSFPVTIHSAVGHQPAPDMLFPLYCLATLATALLPRVAAVASTDSYTDADPAQSGYLPNHIMDPAVVDSSSFGQLWKVPFNAKEQVRETSRLVLS